MKAEVVAMYNLLLNGFFCNKEITLDYSYCLILHVILI